MYLNHKKHSPKLRYSQGFSLVEILVVVVIIGILAALIVPNIIKRPEQARIVRANQDVRSIQNAMEMYKMDNFAYPTQQQGIGALVKKPTSEPIPPNWQGYLRQMPMDPWGKLYHYKNPGDHSEIDVWTDGPPGGPIIGNWEEKKKPA